MGGVINIQGGGRKFLQLHLIASQIPSESCPFWNRFISSESLKLKSKVKANAQLTSSFLCIVQGRPIYFTIRKDSSFQKPTHFWPWKCSCNLNFSVLAASVAIILNERLCPPHVHSILLQLRLGATCLKRMSGLESSARPNDSWHQSRLRLDSGKLKKWGQIMLF